jgi:type VII secretion-associated serine protease mycosin
VRTLVISLLCVLGLGALVGGVLLAFVGPAPSQFDQAKALWYTTPVDQLFPGTLDVTFSNLENTAQTLVRVGVSPPAACASALDPQLAAQVAAHRCRAVLRATYTNQVRSLVATAAIVALDDTQADSGSLPSRPTGGVRVAAFPNTAAAAFTDQRRVVSEASFSSGMPYGFSVSTGLVNGAVDAADLRTQAIQSGAQSVSDGLLSALHRGMTRRAFGQGAAPALASFAATRTDAVRGQEWWLGSLQVSQAWTISRGQGVTVAVLDTGVDPTHPDLTGSVTTGPDLYPDGAQPGNADWGQHGTAMASLIAGHGHGAGAASGMIGVAPAAKILSIRAIPDDNDHRPRPPSVAGDTQLALAIRYAADHGAQVISMSLGDSDYGAAGGRRSEQQAIDYAIAHGVVVVASAGNSGTTTNVTKYPAAYPGVIAVAAVDRGGAHASFSERAWYLSVAAPGVDVPGCIPGGQYVTGSGTSPAGAFIAGVAADILARQPKLNPAQVKQLLEGTAKSGGAWNRDNGWGVVQPLGALQQAATVAPEPPAPRPVAQPGRRFAAPAGAAAGTGGQRRALSVGLAGLGAAGYGVAVFLALWWPRRDRRLAPMTYLTL